MDRRCDQARGDSAELIDAKAVDLPMLDRMRKEYAKGEAPAAMEELAAKIRAADGFLFVTGEYNWGRSPGSRISPTIISRNGSGARRPSPVTRRVPSPGCAR